MIPSGSKVEFHGLATFELQELESIANHVAAEPGRKALVWLCEAVSFSSPPREGPLYSLWFDAVSAAQRAGLAVYSVPCSAGSLYREALSNFSKLTGGRFYSGGYSDLTRAIADARGDNLSAYSVAWDTPPAQNSSLHSLSMRTANDSVKLLVPSALVEPMLPRRQDRRLKAVESALATPLAAKALRISTALEQRTTSQVEVSVTFDARDLSLENPDRKLGGLVDFLFVFYNSAGERRLQGQRSEMALNLQETEEREFVQKPHVLKQKLEVPASAATLRVVVRDANSGRIGSVSVTLP